MRTIHRSTMDSVQRWLALRRDVLISGDVGSGKSTVAEAVFESLRRQGWSGVLLRGIRTSQALPLAPLAGHPSLQLGSTVRLSLDAAVRALRAETESAPAVIVVDDLHLLDDVSLAAFSTLIGSPQRRVQLVATAPAGSRLPPAAAAVVREAVTETVRPLDVSSLTDLLVELLGAPVDARLVTAVSARSQGNARACRVLVTAGAHGGLLRRARGVWALQGSLDTVADGLPAALLSDVDDDLVAALETIAAFGMLEAGYARDLVGADAVDALLRRGRLRSHRHEGETFVLVSPPALAIALRKQLSDERRGDLGRRALELSAQTPHDPDAVTLAASLPMQWHGPAETAGLLAESLTVQRAMARALWETEPSITHALPLLRQHLFNDSDPRASREIFERTVASSSDGPRPSVTYAMMQGLWDVLQGSRFSETVLAAAPLPAEFEAGAPTADFLGALDRMYAGERIVGLHGSFSPAALPWPLSYFATVLQARIEVELGQPDQALETLGPRHRQPTHRSVEDITAIEDIADTVRADALILAGHLTDAVHFARTCMEEAYDQLSEFGIRMSARSLATALFFTGDHEGALRAVDVGLHLLRGNPLTSSYDERTLGLGAVLYARRGDDIVARSLLDRLQSSPQAFDPGLDLMIPWARLEVEFPRSRTADTDAQALWQHGADMLESGHLATAALCWASTPAVLDEDQLAALDALEKRVRIPLLEPPFALHRSIATGTAAEILAAAGRQPSQGPLLAVAGDRARHRTLEEGLPALTDAEIRLRCGKAAEAMVTGGTRHAGQPLTERELEIALLAREGLSNRQIASHVFLSVRTVENHLYRALHKIGVPDRSGLKAWTPPE